MPRRETIFCRRQIKPSALMELGLGSHNWTRFGDYQLFLLYVLTVQNVRTDLLISICEILPRMLPRLELLRLDVYFCQLSQHVDGIG